MYLADTNIIVRLLVRDDEEQYRDTLQALTILEQRNEPCYVPDIVWIEACWVLQKIYKLDRRSISKALMNLLHTEVIVPMSGHIQEMLSLFGETGVDATDAYLSALSRSSENIVLSWNSKDFNKLNGKWLTPSKITN
jgi:predicted nucleic acid-binding protein